MPIHIAVGSDAGTLTSLVEKVEKTGEKIVAVLPAGNCWAVVTQPAAPKAQTRKAQTR